MKGLLLLVMLMATSLACHAPAPNAENAEAPSPAHGPAMQNTGTEVADSGARSPSRVGNFLRNQADGVATSVEQDVNRITASKSDPPDPVPSNGEKSVSLNGCSYSDAADGALGRKCGAHSKCPRGYLCKAGNGSKMCVPTTQEDACSRRR